MFSMLRCIEETPIYIRMRGEGTGMNTASDFVQSIFGVPIHCRQMRHRGHIAVYVVDIVFDLVEAIADSGSGEAIVGFFSTQSGFLLRNRNVGSAFATSARSFIPALMLHS
jgi:hypothetical protein